MRKLTLLLPLAVLLVFFAFTTEQSDKVENDSTPAEITRDASEPVQNRANTLAEWSQAPSWAFGLPNLVTYMGLVCIIAILSTVVVIAVNSRSQEQGSSILRQEELIAPGAPPGNGTGGRVLTDKSGNHWLIEPGEGNHFLIRHGKHSYQANHDGSWKQITVQSAEENFIYKDNIGKGTYLCTQSGAPLGNLLKVQAAGA